MANGCFISVSAFRFSQVDTPLFFNKKSSRVYALVEAYVREYLYFRNRPLPKRIRCCPSKLDTPSLSRANNSF